jgi:chromosome segregation ATPase
MKILDWLIANWEALAATLGVGGAGWIGGKKALDKRQDAAIEDIHKRLDEMDALIKTVQNELAMNQQADLSSRDRINEMLLQMQRTQEKMHDLLMEIVTGKIKLK